MRSLVRGAFVLFLAVTAGCVGDGPATPTVDAGNDVVVPPGDGGGNEASTDGGQVDAGPPAAVGKTLWVRALPGADVTGVAVDKSGNTFACGSFVGTQVDFGAGKKLSSTKAHDIFVVKLDPSGNTLWAQSIGGSGGSLLVNDELAAGIAVDPSGDVYVAGSSDSGTITFGNATNKLANAFQVGFVAKMGGADGAPRWIAGMSSANDGITSRAAGVAVSANAVFLLMTFGGATLVIDGGGQVANADSAASGAGNWAVAAFEPTNHALLWANGLGQKGTSDGASAIAIDPSGDPIIGGGMSSPGAAGSIVDTLGSINIPRAVNAQPAALFARLSAQNGKQVWSQLYDAPSAGVNANAVGATTGATLFGGSFASANFGKGNLAAQGANDAWIVAYDSTSKSALTTKQIGGTANGPYTYEVTQGLAGDAWGEVIAVGAHVSTDCKADGKPIAGPPSPNYRAAFIAKYDAAGSVLWAKGIASGSAADAVSATSVATTKAGELRVGGTLSGTAALDGTTPVTSPNGGQGFVIALSP